MTFWWYLGYIVAAAAVLVVVVFVANIIGLARTLGVRSAAIGRTLRLIRAGTAPIPAVRGINLDTARATERMALIRCLLQPGERAR